MRCDYNAEKNKKENNQNKEKDIKNNDIKEASDNLNDNKVRAIFK